LTLGRQPFRREFVKAHFRSSGSISANIEEGYGRGLGRDYARFLSFARGSARETQGWYLRARRLLSEQVIEHHPTEKSKTIQMKIVKAELRIRLIRNS
jgi:four helix bundle protein